MAKVVLDIPRDKMSAFLNLIVKLGIERHTIRPRGTRGKHSRLTDKKLYPFSSKFLLFDWEFFSNELEFE